MPQDMKTSTASADIQGDSTTDMVGNAAYTINHATLCFVTDFIDPFIAAWSQKTFGKTYHTSWCNMTHQHTPEIPIPPAPPSNETLEVMGLGGFGKMADEILAGGVNKDKPYTQPHVHNANCGHNQKGDVSLKESLKHWLVGEAVGDVGAVAVTLGIQKVAPGAMRALSQGMEHVVGGLYYWSAQRDAKGWAKAHGHTEYSQECSDYAEKLYRHEVDHLGQAAVWAVSSVALNVASQKLITHNPLPVTQMLFYKSLGALTTSGLLVGGRSLFPNKFNQLDNVTAAHVFTPIMHLVTGEVPSSNVSGDSMEMQGMVQQRLLPIER